MVEAIIFDLDGTLTRVPSPWRYVHDRLGLWETQAAVFFEEWRSGGITYDEFCRRDFQLWSGVTLDQIQRLLDEIPVNRHLPGIVDRLRGTSVESIIISSGFRHVARTIQSQLSWEPLSIYANDIVEGGGDGPELRIRVSADTDSPASKGRLAARALDQAGVDRSRTLAVSDSPRDLEMMAECRYRLLVHNEDDLLRIHSFL